MDNILFSLIEIARRDGERWFANGRDNSFLLMAYARSGVSVKIEYRAVFSVMIEHGDNLIDGFDTQDAGLVKQVLARSLEKTLGEWIF